MKNAYLVFVEKFEEKKGPLGILGIDERIILKLI